MVVGYSAMSPISESHCGFCDDSLKKTSTGERHVIY